MADPRLAIQATPRTIPPDRDLESPLFSLVWQAIQRWSEIQRQLQQERQTAIANENRAWMALADEYFQLQQVRATLALEPAPSNPRVVEALALTLRRLEQTLQIHGVNLIAPVGATYSGELTEVLEPAGWIPQTGLEAAMIHEILVPAIQRGTEVIRFGKAIIAVPEHETGD
ncbi:MAG: hypothetical protein U1F76_19795 [Candidatus Competibacteraceae bacterium]